MACIALNQGHQASLVRNSSCCCPRCPGSICPSSCLPQKRLQTQFPTAMKPQDISSPWICLLCNQPTPVQTQQIMSVSQQGLHQLQLHQPEATPTLLPSLPLQPCLQSALPWFWRKGLVHDPFTSNIASGLVAQIKHIRQLYQTLHLAPCRPADLHSSLCKQNAALQQ